MLLYYLFWMIMGFILHFSIILGTNLLTGGPTQIAVFLPISVFRRKRISNGVQTEWNLRERDFWNKRDPEDLEWTSSNRWGGHEAGGAPSTLVAPPTYFFLLYIYPHTPETSESIHRRNLLYPRDPILEPSSVLRRRGNRPWRASTSSPRPFRWVVSSLPQTFGSIVIS